MVSLFFALFGFGFFRLASIFSSLASRLASVACLLGAGAVEVAAGVAPAQWCHCHPPRLCAVGHVGGTQHHGFGSAPHFWQWLPMPSWSSPVHLQGSGVGLGVGLGVGSGPGVGCPVGAWVGDLVAGLVGTGVGCFVGALVGAFVGACVGAFVAGAVVVVVVVGVHVMIPHGWSRQPPARLVSSGTCVQPVGGEPQIRLSQCAGVGVGA